MSQDAASGEATSLTRATVSAPSRRAVSASSTRSGLRPDCEIARKSAPAIRGRALKIEPIDGPTEETTSPMRISRRYLA